MTTITGKHVFVASWFNLTKEAYEEEGDEEIVRPWLDTPIDTNKVKAHAKKFLALFSDDDLFVPLTYADLFKKKLNAKIIIKKGLGHYFKTKEIPEIIEFVK